MIKSIDIITRKENRQDIISMLKVAQEIINDPMYSFTFHFQSCSYLSYSSISIMGAIANFLKGLYEVERKNVLKGSNLTNYFEKEIRNIVDLIFRNEKFKKAFYQDVEDIKKNNIVTTEKAIKLSLDKVFYSQNIESIILENYIDKKARNIGIMFDVKSMSNQLRNQLINCNFLSHYHSGFTTLYPEGRYIGFREHKRHSEEDNERLIRHIKDEWLIDEKIHLSPRLKEDIVSRIFELYQNAFGHGISKASTPRDVISCGSYDQSSETISLCIVDLGGGICQNVLEYASKFPHLNSINTNKAALAWALQRGNTTKTDSIDINMPRGVGLDLLKEFVVLNKGKLEIYTNSCCAFINSNGEYEIENIGFDFKGTLAVITINCQEDIIYLYKDEEQIYF